MPMVYVKPAPGGRIRMPERNFVPMPEAGSWVPRDMFYERLISSRDVIECDPPAEPLSEPSPQSDAAPAPKGAGRK